MFVGLMVRVGLAVVLAACVALVAGLWSEPTAHAQGADRDYVDVALILEAPLDIRATSNHDLNVIVVNNGLVSAYDVETIGASKCQRVK